MSSIKNIVFFFQALWLFMNGRIGWGQKAMASDEDIAKIDEALDECELILYREQKHKEEVTDDEKKQALHALKTELDKFGLRTPGVVVTARRIYQSLYTDLLINKQKTIHS